MESEIMFNTFEDIAFKGISWKFERVAKEDLFEAFIRVFMQQEVQKDLKFIVT